MSDNKAWIKRFREESMDLDGPTEIPDNLIQTDYKEFLIRLHRRAYLEAPELLEPISSDVIDLIFQPLGYPKNG